MTIAVRYQRANAVGMPPAFMDAVLLAIENNDPTSDNPAGAVAGALAGGGLIAAATGQIGWATRSLMSSDSDGSIVLQNNALTGFSFLKFGGTTNAFPAIKIAGTTIVAFRLADDSADAGITVNGITASGIISALSDVMIAVGSVLKWNLKTKLYGGAVDGNLTLWNAAQTGFGLLQFGGTTNAFPAIKQTGTTLAFRLADDSGDAPITIGGMVSNGDLQMNAANTFKWITKSVVYGGSVDGNIVLWNNGQTGFGLLQLGGTSATFPALKRSAATLQARLADDSAFASLVALNVIAAGAAASGGAGTVSLGGTTASTVGAAGGATALPATPLGYILINVAGTSAKIPYYNP